MVIILKSKFHWLFSIYTYNAIIKNQNKNYIRMYHVNLSDYKKFLGECQTRFKCSLSQAQVVARKLMTKDAKRKRTTKIICYSIWGSFALLISLLIILSPTPIAAKIIVPIVAFGLCYFFSELTIIMWNSHPTADFYGISPTEVEQCKNQVILTSS